MSVRTVLYASVCSALLAALAAVPASHAAAKNPSAEQAEKAFADLAKGKPDAAIASFTTAIDSNELPPSALANALLNRGLAYQQTNKFEAAIADYSAALRIDALTTPQRSTALFNRGLAYQKVKRPELAVEDFTSALFLDATFSHAYYSRGQALRENGQYLFALSDFEKALRNNYPAPHLVHYGEALTYEALKQPDLAIKSLRLALDKKPGYASARKKLAQLESATPAKDAKPADVAAAVSPDSADQIVKKPDMPAAVAPPAALLNASPEKTAAIEEASTAEEAVVAEAAPVAEEPVQKKLFTDRVPQGDRVIIPAYAMAEAAAPVKKARKPAKTETPEEEPAGAETTASIAPAAEMESQDGERPAWTVQLSSAVQEDLAWSTWKKLKSRNRLLEGQKASVVRADLGKKGVFYRLRLGFDDRGSAQDLCGKLKSKGVSCFVSKAG